MRKPLIHIGYHKAASSWLQLYLFRRRDRGFAPLVPDDELGSKRATKYLARYFTHDEEGKMLSPFRSRSDEVRDQLARLKPPERCVPVMSAEGLSGNPHSGGFSAKAIADRLADSFPDARIFIVIREQVTMILSVYFQYLKKGGTSSLESYLSQEFDGRLPGFAPGHFEYHRLIEYYHGLFGRENVLVLPFEFFRDDGPGFVARLADFAEAEVSGDLEYDMVANPGRPRLVEYRTRFLNSLTHRTSLNSYSSWANAGAMKPTQLLRDTLAKTLPAAAEHRFVVRIRDEIKATTNRRYCESNARTAELIGWDLRALGYE